MSRKPLGYCISFALDSITKIDQSNLFATGLSRMPATRDIPNLKSYINFEPRWMVKIDLRSVAFLLHEPEQAQDKCLDFNDYLCGNTGLCESGVYMLVYFFMYLGTGACLGDMYQGR